MRYLTLGEIVELHRRLLQATGGAPGIRDFGVLESAVAEPKATFGGVDLYPILVEKGAALCFSLVQGHPFIDGNKRVGHAAMETFLVLNGTEVDAPTDAQERLMLDLAAGRIGRSQLTTGFVSISNLSDDFVRPTTTLTGRRERTRASGPVERVVGRHFRHDARPLYEAPRSPRCRYLAYRMVQSAGCGIPLQPRGNDRRPWAPRTSLQGPG